VLVWLLVLLLLVSPAMGKGIIKPPPKVVQTPSTESEQDRYLDELFEKFESGEIEDFDTARKMYEQKFGADPLWGTENDPLAPRKR
jgi:hypothetical protein